MTARIFLSDNFRKNIKAFLFLAAVFLSIFTVILLQKFNNSLAVDDTSQNYTYVAELKNLGVSAMNNSLKYLHTTWWDGNFDATNLTQESVVLPKEGRFSWVVTDDVTIRSQASAAYVTALALGSGYYDSSITTIDNETAKLRTIGWINGLMQYSSTSNFDHSQFSSLILQYTGIAATKVWSDLPAATKDALNSAIIDQANYWLTQEPPYYQDINGNIIYPGDSQSETNAMVGGFMLMAARLYPHLTDSETRAKWEERARLYQISSYATLKQAQSAKDPRITGANLNADGTVTNHDHLAVDYTLAYGEFLQTNNVVSGLSQTTTPIEAWNNFNLVWEAVTKIDFTYPNYNGLATYPSGGTILQKDISGQPIGDIYYPQGPDTGTAIAGSEYKFKPIAMATAAYIKNDDLNGYKWAKAFLQYVLGQQSRHADGRIFSAEEVTSVEYETFVGMLMAENVIWLELEYPTVNPAPVTISTQIPNILPAGTAPLVSLSGPANTATILNANELPELKANGYSQTPRLKMAFAIRKLGTDVCEVSYNSGTKVMWLYSQTSGSEFSYVFSKTSFPSLYPLTAGTYAWSAKVIDDKNIQSDGGMMCGSTGWAPERTFTVAANNIPDKLPVGTTPIVTLTSPTDGATFQNVTNIEPLKAKAYAQTDRVKLAFRIQKVGSDTCYTSWNAGMGYAWSYSLSSGAEGSYTFTGTYAPGLFPLTTGTYIWSAKALDNYGDYSQSGGELFCDSDGWAPVRSFTIQSVASTPVTDPPTDSEDPVDLPTILPEGTAPIVTLSDPANNKNYSSLSIAPTIEAIGNSQTARLKMAFAIKDTNGKCYISRNSGMGYEWTYSQISASIFSYSFSKTSFPELYPLTKGTYYWSAKAIDDKNVISSGIQFCGSDGWAQPRQFTVGLSTSTTTAPTPTPTPTPIPTKLSPGTAPIVQLTTPVNNSYLSTMPTLKSKGYSQTDRLKLAFTIKNNSTGACYTSFNSGMSYMWTYSMPTSSEFSYIFSQTSFSELYPLTKGSYSWSAKAIDDQGLLSTGVQFCGSDGFAQPNLFTIY